MPKIIPSITGAAGGIQLVRFYGYIFIGIIAKLQRGISKGVLLP
jgi:hypothetical protein